MNNKSTPNFPASITYGAVLGQVLVRRRQLAGSLHQKVIADGIGITQSAYSKLEAGQSALSLVHLRQIARQLGATPHELLAETDRYVQHLEAQGVTVTDERSVSAGEVLIGLGILAALFAAAGGG
jgi:transcriptional regulator with XRE-family HTH domain